MTKKAIFLLALTVITLGCWLSLSLYGGSVNIVTLIIATILGWSILLLLIWAAQKGKYWIWICAALLILVGWFLPAPTFVKLFPVQEADPLGSALASTLIVIFSIALIVAAMLLNFSLNLYIASQETKPGGNGGEKTNTGWIAAANLVLSVLLIAGGLYKFYWFMLWDSTGDGLGVFWLPIPVLAVLSATTLLLISLPEEIKLAAFSFLLIIPAMVTITVFTQRVNFYQLTEERAERVSQAIESYYTRNEHYPRYLQDLTPWYMLGIPEPVIIYGQQWCYDAGEDYYRLGYIYRQHWSDPRLIGKVDKIGGELPDLPRMCEAEFIAFQQSHPDYLYEYFGEEK